jgi:hypothetical protein
VSARADLAETLDRFESHLAANGVDLAQVNPTLGPVLTFLPDEERFASTAAYDLGAWGNRLLRGTYRPPFVVPEQV